MSFNHIFYLIHVIIATLLGMTMTFYPQLLWKIEYGEEYRRYASDFYMYTMRAVGIFSMITGILAFLNMNIDTGYSFLNQLASLHLVDHPYLLEIELLILGIIFSFFSQKMCKISSSFYVEGGQPKTLFLLGCRFTGSLTILCSVLFTFLNIM